MPGALIDRQILFSITVSPNAGRVHRDLFGWQALLSIRAAKYAALLNQRISIED
jgi:hypothetical protein